MQQLDCIAPHDELTLPDLAEFAYRSFPLYANKPLIEVSGCGIPFVVDTIGESWLPIEAASSD